MSVLEDVMQKEKDYQTKDRETHTYKLISKKMRVYDSIEEGLKINFRAFKDAPDQMELLLGHLSS